MRAPLVVLLLVAAAPAFADTPPPADVPPPADAAPPAPPAPPPPPPAADTADTPPPGPPLKLQPIVPPPILVPPPALDAGEPGPIVRTRYGYRWQTITTDAIAIALSLAIDRIAADGGTRPGALATITIGSYFFSAPLIHGVHRQGKRALASFGLRAGLPLVLGLLGEAIDDVPPCDNCKDTLRSDGKVIGLTVGVLVAMAVDNVLLTRPIFRRTERPRAAWTPAVRGVRGGATAGVSGTF
jgi:hypothetical protein